ncbi:MAG: hypothetical protein QMC80_09225, partial [Thermoplasmatales archaeon]|nr:hypothetical protein [Thermoplasmatales archaeon]
TNTVVKAGEVVLGSVVELGVKVGEIVVETGKKAINMVQDGLVYLAEVQKCILETAWGYIEKACEVIVSAIQTLIDAFLDWIWSAITAAFEVITKPIMDAIINWGKGIADALDTVIFEYVNSDGRITQESINKVGEALFGSLLSYIKPLIDALQWVVNLIKPFLDAVKGLVDDAIGFIGNIFTSTFRDGESDNTAESTDPVLSAIFGAINTLLSVDDTPSPSSSFSLSTSDIAKIVLMVVSGFSTGFGYVAFVTNSMMMLSAGVVTGGLSTAIFSYLFTLFSMITLVVASAIASMPWATKDARLALIYLGVYLSFVGGILGAVGAAQAFATGNVAVMVFSGIGSACGFISTGIGVYDWYVLEGG